MMLEKNKISVPLQDLEHAWARIKANFPFKGYIRESRKSGYFQMVRKVVKWTNRDVKVLDFGAGPCDKTGLFSLIGMDVTAFDTLDDKWHKLNNNQEKIVRFANKIGIDYYLPNGGGGFTFPDKQYDVIMLHNVIEHLHNSPRSLLNKLIPYLRSRGILSITVPNAANLRKRIHLLLGKTNYNRFEYFYWYPGLWKGHIREYVKNDLLLLNKFLGLKLIELSSYHLQLDALPQKARPLFVGLSYLFPGCRDSWMLIARKPPDWEPRFKPNPNEFQKAFGSQYYDYSNAEFNWED